MKKLPRKYEADDIEVTYDVKRCIHSAECTRGLPAVFDTAKRPWIQPENGDAQAIAEVIHRCPTGALQYRRKDGGTSEPIPARNTFLLDANGPLYLRGDLHFTDPSGEPIKSETRIAMCRCGASKNKPYCDDSHDDIDFKASGAITEEQKSEADSGEPTGKLMLDATRNGPMVCQGTIAAVGADGLPEAVFDNPAFCRCGGSQNKPFCDGTHSKIGFKSD